MTNVDWIEQALNGKVVVLVNGLVASIRYKETEFGKYLVGVINNKRQRPNVPNIVTWNFNGECLSHDLPNMVSFEELNIFGCYSHVLNHWNVLSRSIKAIAKDKDGRWYGYKTKNCHIDGHIWKGSSEYTLLNNIDSSVFPECDWKNSLIIRPE